MDASANAGQLSRRVDSSDWLDQLVRVGLLSYGVVHLLIAWLALRLAFGSSSGKASATGALAELAQNSVGQISLFVVALGFVALVVWQGVEAAVGHRLEEGGKRTLKRATSAGKVVVYGTLAVSAFRMAIGAGSGGGGTDTMTAKLMSVPGGQLLVAAVGVGLIVVAGFLVYMGLTERFTKMLDSGAQSQDRRTAIVWLGKAGHIAKGVALAIVGVLFLYAAATHDPNRSGGLDQALRKVLEQPFGSPLLVLIALGIACYGLFCFAWARHLNR
jgi:hypothetical protein